MPRIEGEAERAQKNKIEAKDQPLDGLPAATGRHQRQAWKN